MASKWDKFKACLDRAPKDSATGASIGAGAGGILAGPGGAAVGAGTGLAVGGLYGCIEGAYPGRAEQWARDVGNTIVDASVDVLKGSVGFWGQVGRSFKGGGGGRSKQTPFNLDAATTLTMWHLYHRRRLRFEYCNVDATTKDVPLDVRGPRGECAWGGPSADLTELVWHADNREAIYGLAGRNTPAETFYLGIAVQYQKLANRWGKDILPEYLLALAIASYGDFLRDRFASGQRQSYEQAYRDPNGIRAHTPEAWRNRPSFASSPGQWTRVADGAAPGDDPMSRDDKATAAASKAHAAAEHRLSHAAVEGPSTPSPDNPPSQRGLFWLIAGGALVLTTAAVYAVHRRDSMRPGSMRPGSTRPQSTKDRSQSLVNQRDLNRNSIRGRERTRSMS